MAILGLLWSIVIYFFAVMFAFGLIFLGIHMLFMPQFWLVLFGLNVLVATLRAFGLIPPRRKHAVRH